jgi:hypothetical protein
MYKAHSFDLAFYGHPDSPVVFAFTNKTKKVLEHLFPGLSWRHDRWYITSINLDDLEAIAEAAENAGLWVAVFGIGETFH